MKPLNIREFPLTGTSLIEASAGTGKTYTIASLYSRLVLGHQTGYPPLRTDQVLVVTFTNAATEELRGRIRERLRDNLGQLLCCQADMELTDSEYLKWLQDLALVGDSQALEEKTEWLQANLSLMDSASIFTIHGFAQRMLKQFAFDVGILFDSELMMETDELLTTASEDVWRQLLYPQSQSRVSFFKGIFPSPDRLKKRVRGWLSRPGLQLLPMLSPEPSNEMPSDCLGDQPVSEEGEVWERDWRRVETTFVTLKSAWQALGSPGVGDLIKTSGVSKRSYSGRNLPRWLGVVDSWLAGHCILPLPAEVKRFGTSQLEAATPEGKSVPHHGVFDLVEQLLAQAEQLQARVPQWCLSRIKKRFAELLEQSSALSPDDLLRFLDRALNDQQGGAQKADLLAQQIRRLYPIALIDEFQDTDSLQFRIFSKIYPAVMSGKPSAFAQVNGRMEAGQEAISEGETSLKESPYGLVAIGDPKQAIYGFRGADIYTYIQARRSLSDERIFTLSTNWRSHSGLIQGVNQLFERHPAPFVLDQDIPFYPVQSSGKKDGLHLLLTSRAVESGQTTLPSPLTIWTHSEPSSVSEARALAACQCAGQISSLIRGAGIFNSALRHSEKATGRDAGIPVVAGDIAVLVRSHDQAALMKRALAERGVGSVLLSKESVFESREAADLLLWLSAIAHPNQESRIRAAIATETQGYSLSELESIQNDSERWDQEVRHFLGYQKNASQQGIMSALMRWLNQGSRAARLAGDSGGERRLTNVLHLGELLQGASRRLSGLVRLHAWLDENIREAMSDGGAASEQSQLRLETDANLVSIVTIHKSKGLEYPLVFLPFLWGDDFTRTDSSQSFYFDPKLERLVAHQAPDELAKEQALLDSQAEAMRLLYVALTRACQGCFLWVMNAGSTSKKSGWNPVLHKSAFGQLLGSEQMEFGGIDAAPDIAAQIRERFTLGGAGLNPPQAVLSADTEPAGALLPGDACEIADLQVIQGLGISEFGPWEVDSGLDQGSRHGGNNEAAPETVASEGEAIYPASFGGLDYDPWRLSSFSQLIGGQSPSAHLELLQTDEDLPSDPPLGLGSRDSYTDLALLMVDPTDQALSGSSAGLATAPSASLSQSTTLGAQRVQERGSESQQRAIGYPAMAFDFPRGANAGTCLHAILERWDFNSSEALLDIAEFELSRYGIYLGMGADTPEQDAGLPATLAWQDGFSAWFSLLVKCPLKDAYTNDLSLSAIAQSSRLDELEFYLPVDSLAPAQVDRLLNQSDLVRRVTERNSAQSVHETKQETASGALQVRVAGEPDQYESDVDRESFEPGHRAALDFSRIDGFLKGFIDLVFEYQGRYYLLDYKSNYLGASVEAYHQAAMEGAMYAHYYDLQAWIYTLALDRYLAARINGYDPEQHLGGVFYLFLRGMSGEGPKDGDGLKTEDQLEVMPVSSSLTMSPAMISTADSTPIQADLFEANDAESRVSRLDSEGNRSLFDSAHSGLNSFHQNQASQDQPDSEQCFGVYYRTIDKQALQQWRQLFGLCDTERQEDGT